MEFTKLIRINFPNDEVKRLRIFFSLVALLGFAYGFICSGCALAQNQVTNKTSDQHDTAQPQIYVVGEKLEKGAMDSFSQGMKKMDEEFAPMNEGEILFAKGQYKEARDKYILSLQIHQKHKSLEWLPRWYLAEVYEKLNDRENAGQQLDWLIKDCQNEETKKGLISRRDNLVNE